MSSVRGRLLSSFTNSGKHKRDANSLTSSDNSNTDTQSALAKHCPYKWRCDLGRNSEVFDPSFLWQAECSAVPCSAVQWHRTPPSTNPRCRSSSYLWRMSGVEPDSRSGFLFKRGRLVFLVHSDNGNNKKNKDRQRCSGGCLANSRHVWLPRCQSRAAFTAPRKNKKPSFLAPLWTNLLYWRLQETKMWYRRLIKKHTRHWQDNSAF